MSIYSILLRKVFIQFQYDIEEDHEFNRIFDGWTDAEYLESFFEEHKEDLQNGILGKYYD